MSALEKHGLRNLSASQANLFTAQPSGWLLQKLYKRYGEPSPAMLRGNAAEDGIVIGLKDLDLPVEDCIAAAHRVYDEKTALSNHPNIDKERNALAGYVTHGLAELRQYGTPSAFQERIELRLEDVPVPVIGFTDLEWDNHGIIVDIKTSARMPSTISDSHARQGAIYFAARKSNYDMRFAYIKPAKGRSDNRTVNCFSLTPDEAHQRLEEVRQTFIRMERFLSLSDDRDELAALLVPDFSHWFWNSDAIRAEGRALYGW
jgi:hypothetical protein